MSLSVFLSYRRADTIARNAAFRVRDHLARRFGSGFAFLDNENLKPGTQWQSDLRQALQKVDAIYAFIGPNWEKELKPAGKTDYMVEEMEAGLSAKKLVPVLVERDRLPPVSETHTIFTSLRTLQAHPLDLGIYFEPSVERLLSTTVLSPGVLLSASERLKKHAMTLLLKGDELALRQHLDAIAAVLTREPFLVLLEMLAEFRTKPLSAIAVADANILLSKLTPMAKDDTSPEQGAALLLAAYIKAGCFEADGLTAPGLSVDALVEKALHRVNNRDLRALLSILIDKHNRAWRLASSILES